MGRIFLNPRTGEVIETNRQQRKPPNGFTEQLGRIDYRIKPRIYQVKTFYCSDCGKYHGIFHWGEKFPIYKLVFAVYSSIFGCNKAKEIVEIGKILGGQRRHYDLATFIVLRQDWEKEKQKLESLPEEEKKRLIKQLAKSLQNK